MDTEEGSAAIKFPYSTFSLTMARAISVQCCRDWTFSLKILSTKLGSSTMHRTLRTGRGWNEISQIASFSSNKVFKYSVEDAQVTWEPIFSGCSLTEKLGLPIAAALGTSASLCVPSGVLVAYGSKMDSGLEPIGMIFPGLTWSDLTLTYFSQQLWRSVSGQKCSWSYETDGINFDTSDNVHLLVWDRIWRNGVRQYERPYDMCSRKETWFRLSATVVWWSIFSLDILLCSTCEEIFA